ncbi:AAL099Cp [Eremothecium gossypii ATCC 10895]|uniref:DNA polymerase n=1 Tax=Eremothecium gossypii (strain ATCC 10895 / CBS 109.51 / FGSC 9923 / NRRL Y-1056) TaxID=284811 RepID=Q75F27_EREGS|nr:AAL099Cp [Eremothecium gossypii ATCC 10895]AAS50267.2 AAL099Cp [Eremothecium gossypii ATCC 10895]
MVKLCSLLHQRKQAFYVMSQTSNHNLNSSEGNEDLIQIQWSDYDCYQWPPTSLDPKHSLSWPGKAFSTVPIIRFYGKLTSGHNILSHLHGALPYLFISCDAPPDELRYNSKATCHRLHVLLELALLNTSTKSHGSESAKQSDSTEDNIECLRYVANVSVVKGVPFYGFNVGWSVFYKISLLNPRFVTLLANKLRDGSILGRSVSVYEAHIPYLLQTSADFNLYGCAYLNLTDCYFRGPVLNNLHNIDEYHQSDAVHTFLKRFLRPDNTLPREFERFGTGLLEIDILPQFIANREELEYRYIHHDFIDALRAPANPNKKYLVSTNYVWKDVTWLRESKELGPYLPPDELQGVETRPPWDFEELERFHQLAKQQNCDGNPKNLSFATFIDNSWFYENIKTASETISELWPKPLNGKQKIVALPDDEDNEEPLISTIDSVDIERLLYSTPKLKRVKAQHGLLMRDDRVMNINPQSNKKHKSYTRESKLPVYRYKSPPISYADMSDALEANGEPAVDYQGPYYSNPVDLPKGKDNTTHKYNIESDHISCREWVSFGDEVEFYRRKLTGSPAKVNHWVYIPKPPKYYEVLKQPPDSPETSCIDGPTQSQQSAPSQQAPPNMSNEARESGPQLLHLSMEIHVDTRRNMLPNPRTDEIKMICWSIDGPQSVGTMELSTDGLLVSLNENDAIYKRIIEEACGKTRVAFFTSEYELITEFAKLVLIIDPDILSGYETNKSSWGYILARAELSHNIDFGLLISRLSRDDRSGLASEWNYSHSAGIKIAGRHMLNVWRKMRTEVNLAKYNIENVAYHLLHERLPKFTHETLSGFWRTKSDRTSIKIVINYCLERVRCNIRLLNLKQVISRTVEQARLIGIDFYSVLSRGSQYRVESVLARLAKAEHLMLISPGKGDLRHQRALECVPLILEPDPTFYTSPVLVLDFQSLYPSIIIAYNYCYTTILGRTREMTAGENKIGITTNILKPNILQLLGDNITIAPNGVTYVKQNIRKSILAKMLSDILDTRVLLKRTISDMHNGSKRLLSTLDNRQLALKLLANVTYGYASASYSGRMPCSDIADSIVHTGRETLRAAIQMIEKEDKWGARVVYGDTDSLFVHLPGKSREQAFKIGAAISDAVTAANPNPIKLKFEKVYHPCILLSKKRYVGHAYEHASQEVPRYDAKGIETVRRDGHPAQRKIIQRSLEILFRTKDLSQLKAYIVNQFWKIMTGSVPIGDFCFSKEVRLGFYKSEAAAPPAAQVARRMMENDSMAEPQYRERVSYVVAKSRPGTLLADRCIAPQDFLADPRLELDAEYYITKTLIPPLNRLLQTVGLDLFDWYREMPRPSSYKHVGSGASDTLHHVLKSNRCLCCKREATTKNGLQLCDSCRTSPSESSVALLLDRRTRESRFNRALRACRVCCFPLTKDLLAAPEIGPNQCQAHDCPVFYTRKKYEGLLSDPSWHSAHRALQLLDDW